MQQQRTRDTAPEVTLRRLLHARGLRYRVQRRLLDSRRSMDIVFGPARVVVDVRGCYWHGCADHCRLPTVNRDWWVQKIARNRARDADTEVRLKDAGWYVEVVWEHEDMRVAAERIAAVVATRRQSVTTGHCDGS